MDRPPKIRTVDSDNELQQAARRYTRLFIVILTFAAQPGLCSVRRAGRGVTLLAVALLACAGISAQAATPTPGYVITLESSRRGIRPEALDAVSKVPNRVAYITRATVNDVAWERLKLGFFASEEEANQILAGLKREFPQAWVGTAMPEDLDHYRVHTAVASSARLEPKIPATVEPKVTATVEPKVTAKPEPKVTAKVEPEIPAKVEPGVAVVGSAAASAAGGAAIVVAEPARPETGVTPGLSSSPPAGESYPQATTLPFERVDTGIGTYGAPGRDEIAAFRLTDVSGSASVRYLLDDQQRENNFETNETIEEEFFLLTRSYVYHPDFLNMKLGGGPLLVQQQFDSNQGSNNNQEVLFNFVADLGFLEQKAYPLRTYYQRSHPTITTNLAGSFLVERNEYGLNTMLREPLSPIQMKLDAFHIDSLGSGYGASLDENIDEASFNAFKSYLGDNRISATYRWNRRASNSGSPGLPIQSSLITTRSAGVDARNTFGRERQATLVQQLNLIDQDIDLDQLTQVQDRQYLANLDWTHSPETRSFYRYRYNNSIRSDLDRRSQGGVAGVNHQAGSSLNMWGDVHADSEQDTDFSSDLMGARGNLSFTRDVGFGTLNLGAGLRADRTDQESSSDQVMVFDEPLLLVGTNQVALANSFILQSSVIVRNVPKTQVFVEGLDYRLVTIGSQTSIQRLIGGNIFDGQTVLVDYQYQTGGTVAFDTLGQNYVADLRFLTYFGIYFRYSDQQNDVTSGDPSFILNSVNNMEVGFRVDYPLGASWTLGGEWLHTDHDEDLTPFVRESLDVYALWNLPYTTTLRLASHRETVDNEGSDEDVDLVQYLARIKSSPRWGISIAADIDHLEDVGGSLPRTRTAAGVGAEWAYRMLRIWVRVQYVDETQGLTQHQHTVVSAQLVRAF